MRWICTLLTLSIFSLIELPTTFAQSQTSVVEARITKISVGPIFSIRIEKVINGQPQDRTMDVHLASEHAELGEMLLKFRSQKWMMTLIHEGGKTKIRAAFGLREEDEDLHNGLPAPIIIPESMIHRSEPAKQYGRTVIAAKQQEMVELTNQARWDNGMLAPYKQVDLLHETADGHSGRMGDADFFAHCDLYTKKSPFTRMTDAGYYWNGAAENIAAGFSDAWNTILHPSWGWMNSPGHRANILSTSSREIGVGYHYSGDGQTDRFDNGACELGGSGGPYGHYWTQNFGRRNSVYPVVIEREQASTGSQSVELFVYGPSNASSMRFRNENGSWSNWVNYTPDYLWTLSSGNGVKTVYAQVSTGNSGSGSVYSASDQIDLNGNCSTMIFQNQTLSGNQTYSDCEIVADPKVTISGQIIFNANTVTLGNDVTIPLGATLNVQIQ